MEQCSNAKSISGLLKNPKKTKITIGNTNINKKMYDIIIRNGKVIDGTGKRMLSADVAVKENEIAEIGDLSNELADIEINARGKYVTPGFIDVNNHSDTYWRIFLSPSLESLLLQGITTIIGGNCGSSLAPLANHDMIQSIQKWSDISKINLNWLGMDEFLDEMGRKKLPVNFGTLVGHSTIRRSLIGDEVRNLDSGELRSLNKILEQALDEGALGLSTGLIYMHAKLATKEEIENVVRVVKKYGGVYATHVRDESHDLVKSVKEALQVAEKTGVKLQISHLKAMGEKNWYQMDKALELIGIARKAGLDVDFDAYPYATTGSVLYTLLPDWVARGGKKIMINRLKNPDTKTRVIAEMKKTGFDYSKISIAISPLDKTLTKKKITEMAEAQGKSVEEMIVDLLIVSNGRVIVSMDVLDEDNVAKAIKHPFSIISSNGSGYDIDHENSCEAVHPRNFGTFPRVLSKYVKEGKLISWEEAINKMSGKPAEKFSLKKRGTIAVKNYADIVVLDPDNVRDTATNDNPYQYSQGIDSVIVNGRVIVQEGQYNGGRYGEIIRR